MPNALAPPSVAMVNASIAGIELASWLTPFASNAAVLVSLNISKSLLLAAPSVPMARGISALDNFEIGQKPLASFKFDSGQ